MAPIDCMETYTHTHTHTYTQSDPRAHVRQMLIISACEHTWLLVIYLSAYIITEGGRKRMGGAGGYSSGSEKKKKRVSVSDEPG